MTLNTSTVFEPRSPASDDVDRIRLFLTNLKSSFDLIRLADQKAVFLLRICLTLFGVAFIGVPPSVAALKRFVAEGGWQFVMFVAVVVLYAICAVCLLVAIIKLIRVVKPLSAPKGAKTSLFLFATVTQMDFDHFRQTVLGLNRDETLDELMRQFHQSSMICQQKYDSLGDAINWMLGGGLLGIMFALILLISMGLM